MPCTIFTILFISLSPYRVSDVLRKCLRITLSIVTLYIIQGFIQDYKNIGQPTDILIQTRNVIFVSSILLSIIGFIYFTIQTRKLHKKDFSIYKFVLGLKNEECFKK